MASATFIRAAIIERENLERQIVGLKAEIAALDTIIKNGVKGAHYVTLKSQGSMTIGTFQQKIKNVDIDHFYPSLKQLPAKTTSITWKDYLYDAIVFRGGEAKVSEIAQLVVFSNKNITMTRVKNAANDKLPELVKEGKLEVIGSPSRKEGYTYKVKESEADASE